MTIGNAIRLNHAAVIRSVGALSRPPFRSCRGYGVLRYQWGAVL